MDLSNLSLQDLRSLETQLKTEIKRREHEDMARAREQILAIAHSVGIPLKDLIGAGGARGRGAATAAATGVRSAVPVRYRHPENASLQWTGRGRQPKWVVEWVASGQSMDALRV
ncbi:H-NS histone family protein [Massilia sp. W12]|uniref:H-NS histone family protein n=1 Tax=Massilia sp. W12 TaxID=3126507 RepID=UPI0030CE1BA4